MPEIIVDPLVLDGHIQNSMVHGPDGSVTLILKLSPAVLKFPDARNNELLPNFGFAVDTRLESDLAVLLMVGHVAELDEDELVMLVVSKWLSTTV